MAARFTTCCISCNKQIRDETYNIDFYPNLLVTLSAFIVLGAIVVLLVYLHCKQQRMSANWKDLPDPVPMGTAALVLGIGLGGFIDGIVFHQIFQWHEMFSAKLPATDYVGKSINMFWDGIFHAFCLLVVLTGVIMLWRTSRKSISYQSGWLLSGALLSGWAIFNLVEGTINHHILKLHNVMEYSQDHDLANGVFLAASVLLLMSGILLSRIHYCEATS